MATGSCEPGVSSGTPFTVHSSVQDFLRPPPAFLIHHFGLGDSSSSSSQSPPHFIATGAVVFDRTPSTDHTDSSLSPPRVLLVQRAAHDSMPLSWETPGGGCDDDDPSVLSACARELREEAGLEAVAIGPVVRCPPADGEVTSERVPTEGVVSGETMGGQFFFTRRGKLVCKFYFIVQPKTYDVVVDPNEHAAYVWATEDEVRKGRMQGKVGEETMELRFTTADQRSVLLEAFDIMEGRRARGGD